MIKILQENSTVSFLVGIVVLRPEGAFVSPRKL